MLDSCMRCSCSGVVVFLFGYYLVLFSMSGCFCLVLFCFFFLLKVRRSVLIRFHWVSYLFHGYDIPVVSPHLVPHDLLVLVEISFFFWASNLTFPFLIKKKKLATKSFLAIKNKQVILRKLCKRMINIIPFFLKPFPCRSA